MQKYKTSTKKQTDDDIEKAHKENKITGQIGEKLAYQYFMNLIEKIYLIKFTRTIY